VAGKITDSRKYVGKKEIKGDKVTPPESYTAAGVGKAEPPMAKPPSGKNPGTLTPTAKVGAAPKVAGGMGATAPAKTAGPRMPKLRVSLGGVNLGGPAATGTLKSEFSTGQDIVRSPSTGYSPHSGKKRLTPNPIRHGPIPRPAPEVKKGDFGLDPSGRPATLPVREAPSKPATRPASEFKLPAKRPYVTPPAVRQKLPVNKAMAAGAGGGAAPMARPGQLGKDELAPRKPGIFARLRGQPKAPPPEEDLSHLNAPPPPTAPRITSRARAVGALAAIKKRAP